MTAAFKLTPAQDRALDMLNSKATDCALGGGSRSGKTFLLVLAVLVRALKSPGSRHVIFRFRFNSVKSYIIYDTLPKVVRLCFPELPSVDSMLNKTDWFLRLPNGSEIWFGGLDDKERVEKILGGEYATVYFNECSQIPWTSVTTALTRLAQKTKNLVLKAYYDFNPPSKKHWTYRWFVERRSVDTNQPLEDEFAVGFYLINPADNKENLDPEYIKRLESLPEKQRNRFLLGKFADDTEGALFTEEVIQANRVLGQQSSPLPDFLRVNVSVDPSGCRGDEDFRSDEIGITVNALGTNGHGYTLEDLSGRYSPEEWGRIAVDAYKRHKASCVVGEINYGGDMVRAIIHAADKTVPYKEVHASRGKVVRAEPVSFLHEQGKIHMVGYHPELEEQLCGMTQSGYEGLRSPDRGDSHIWGMTDLFPEIVEFDDKPWTPPPRVKVNRSARRFDRV